MTRRELSHDLRILLMTLAAGFPAVLVALLLLWFGDFTPKVQWTLTIFVMSFWLGFAFAVRERVMRPLQTLGNLIAALSEGDFSVRGRAPKGDEALGLAVHEVNQLGSTLREQRLGAVEATQLLRQVMAEIDVAVFAFDDAQRLQLVNRAGERLLARSAKDLLGHQARTLGLDNCLDGPSHRVLDVAFAGGAGRWDLRRGDFRQGGRPHQLLVLSDLSRALREEELQAWKRLVRVLSHEINNSLAPIKSMAGSLSDVLRREPRPSDLMPDLTRGLDVIGGRSEALIRFMQSYARLARLPPPRRETLNVDVWVRRVAGLETRLSVNVVDGPRISVDADGDQLDQLLINLVNNAVDAALETGGGVRVGWDRGNGALEVWVEDDGPGLADTANLFVPFFTTKPSGSGIGLVLCRQIAEAHGGTLTLENRSAGNGCMAKLRLPI
jgi:nitrogen fixation/metabolism regulation signal transduction histidine kinase